MPSLIFEEACNQRTYPKSVISNVSSLDHWNILGLMENHFSSPKYQICLNRINMVRGSTSQSKFRSDYWLSVDTSQSFLIWILTPCCQIAVAQISNFLHFCSCVCGIAQKRRQTYFNHIYKLRDLLNLRIR